MANGDDDSAFGGAVELRQNQAGAVDRVGKILGLTESVLAGGGVEYQQGFVRRAFDLLADDTMNFGQLLYCT